ncbi:UNVERIFIED_CONTAM: hypothetical protein GTU68_042878 [Idotea baltica]|nr:hypothetical protein [Idotea baltica]
MKKFGQFTALEQISLSIEKGEFVCFLGPSGCGKTTLLRSIAGLDLPTSGSIFQHGKETTFLPPEKRDFGIVFQSYALFPNLTIEENIAIGLKNQGSKFPNQLSGGQQQRVALARALALSPGLLLLDEPLSALDAKVRTHLRDEICQLQKKLGITTVMVTHDQEEALSMADRIVVMNHGVIEQVGTPEEIYQQPATRFVADFVGCTNFIPAMVLNESMMRIGDTVLPLPSLSNLKPNNGERFELAVRPENLTFFSESTNTIPVRIESVEFQGSYVRVECQLHRHVDCDSIYIDVAAKDAYDSNFELGEIRYVSFSEDSLQAYAIPAELAISSKAA